MTGLDPDSDVIIQIACFVTDYDLNVLDEQGFETVVHQPKEKMDQMDAWCTKTHRSSGLTAAVIKSTVSADEAANALFAYVKQYAPQQRKALLAGSTVHADKAFLRQPPYNKVTDHLHHRILDVSAIKEAARRWAPADVIKNSPQKKYLHEARQDILESIEEAKYYRETLFQKVA